MAKSRESEPDDEDAGGVTRADILNWIRADVWSGEYDAEEVAILVEEQLGPDDEPDKEWLVKAIRKEFAVKRKAEKTWPAVTDCDRLDRAFAILGRRGLIALHMAGFTQSEGLEEVEETYHEDGGAESGYAGHCFYTMRDQKWALGGDGLHVGFGHLAGDDGRAVAVGHVVREALEHEGLGVEWDGTIQSRLHMKGFRWQRRSPG